MCLSTTFQPVRKIVALSFLPPLGLYTSFSFYSLSLLSLCCKLLICFFFAAWNEWLTGDTLSLLISQKLISCCILVWMTIVLKLESRWSVEMKKVLFFLPLPLLSFWGLLMRVETRFFFLHVTPVDYFWGSTQNWHTVDDTHTFTTHVNTHTHTQSW